MEKDKATIILWRKGKIAMIAGPSRGQVGFAVIKGDRLKDIHWLTQK